MFEKLKSFLMGYKKLSAEKAEEEVKKMSEDEQKEMAADAEAHEKMKSYLMDKEKMSAEDAEKKLAEMDDEGKEKLADEIVEKEKKLNEDADVDMAEDKEKKEAEEKLEAEKKEEAKKLAAKRDKITKLSSDMRSSIENARLAAKKAEITGKLSRLKASAKITPAEIKKINLSELAAKDEAVISEVLKTYENREPQVLTGVVGSSSGESVGKAYKSTKMSRLEKEVLSYMPFTRMALGEEEGKEEECASDTVNIHVDTDPHTDLGEAHKMADGHHQNVLSALDAGKMDEAKEHLKKLMEHCKKHMGAAVDSELTATEDSQAQMSALAESVNKLQTQYKELLSLISE